MPDVTVRPLDPGVPDALLAVWCEILAAGRSAETGTAVSPSTLATDIRAEQPGPAKLRWYATLRDRLAGAAQANRDGDRMFLRISVDDGLRRRGAGRALLAAATDAAAATGVRVMRGMVTVGSAGERFAVAAGAEPLLHLPLMQQRPGDVTAAELRPLAEPSPAYRLVRWHRVAPDELATSYAAARRYIMDAPGAHLQIDDATTWDVAWVRQREAAVQRDGTELWVVAAVAPDRTVAGFTEVEVPPAPGTAASQHDTVVVPSHRGRGLGTALKAASTLELKRRRPDITTVTSTINAANTPMLAASRRVGYRELRRRALVQLTVRPR